MITFLFISFVLFSQTVKLTGKVIGEKNEPLTGITIKIVGTDLGTSTNLEGRFSLNLSSAKKYELQFSGVGHETKIVEVEAQNGQYEELNIVLSVKTKEEQSVVVTTKTTSARKETVNAAITF